MAGLQEANTRFGPGLVLICLLLGVLLVWHLIVFKAGLRISHEYSDVTGESGSLFILGAVIAAANFLLVGLAIYWLITQRQPTSIWLAIAAIWLPVIAYKAHRLLGPESHLERTVLQKVEIGLEWLLFALATLYLLTSPRVAALYQSEKLPLFSPRKVLLRLRGRA